MSNVGQNLSDAATQLKDGAVQAGAQTAQGAQDAYKVMADAVSGGGAPGTADQDAKGAMQDGVRYYTRVLMLSTLVRVTRVSWVAAAGAINAGAWVRMHACPQRPSSNNAFAVHVCSESAVMRRSLNVYAGRAHALRRRQHSAVVRAPACSRFLKLLDCHT